jgi:16S rRNA (cytosine1402-N4)-methyltransferase
MTGRGKRSEPVAGGPARHASALPPVLLAEVIEALAIKPGHRILDGTFGAGGYTRAILAAAPDVEVLALDRDPTAIAGGLISSMRRAAASSWSKPHSATWHAKASDAGFAPLDGIVLDIGVSSMQLDQAQRGFSFRFDGPLDMRMAASGQSAADLVNDGDEAELADIIYHYGEERRSRAVARAILEARRQAPITTHQASWLTLSPAWSTPSPVAFIRPPERSRALRIAVNDELGELVRALHGAEEALKPGGRLAVVSFHSLEDRIVKQFLQRRSGRAGGGFSRHAPQVETDQATFTLVHRGVIAPGDAELAINPRARSAKLRVAERTAAPCAWPRRRGQRTGCIAGNGKAAQARQGRPAPDETAGRRGRR